MRTIWLRLASAVIAAGCGLVLWQMVGLAQAIGGSRLLVATMLLAGGVGLVAFLTTFAPQSVWDRPQRRLLRFVAALRSVALTDDRRHGRMLIAGGTIAYLFLGTWHLSQPDDPRDDDQGAYLATAQEVQAVGGPAAMIRDLYAGRFDEANRHPLYIGLLSLHPTPTFGRGTSFVLGLTTLVVLTRLTDRRRGLLCAGVLCVLLGVNGSFCRFSSVVVCDVLMVLWPGIAFLLVGRDRSLPCDVAIGACLGLAYLTKGTGLLLLVGYLIWRGIDALRLRLRNVPESESLTTPQPMDEPGGTSRVALSIAVVVVTWLIVASPLLVRNMRRFGTPFHNVNTSLLFVDRYEDPVVLSQQRSTGAAAYEYLHTHAIGDVLERITSGLVWESFILLRILGPAPFDDARVLFGLLLAICAVVAVAADPRREHALLAVWIVICVPMFAWYIPVAAGDRFPLLLLAPLLICAAEGIVRLARLRFLS